MDMEVDADTSGGTITSNRLTERAELHAGSPSPAGADLEGLESTEDANQGSSTQVDEVTCFAMIRECLPMLAEELRLLDEHPSSPSSVAVILENLFKLGIELTEAEVELLLDRLGVADQVNFTYSMHKDPSRGGSSCSDI